MRETMVVPATPGNEPKGEQALANRNMASVLSERARTDSTRLAVVLPDGQSRGKMTGGKKDPSITYGELNQVTDTIAAGLQSIGVGRGTRTVLMVPPGINFFSLVFALFKAGAVPVVVDPGMGIRSLKKCLADARPEAFIGVPLAHAARVLLGWARPTIKMVVTTGRFRLGGGFTLREITARGSSSGRVPVVDTRPEETAAILFTSGSTGPPRGAVYTHANFVSQVEALRDLYRIEPGEIDLSTFPLFALFAPALGMTAVVPDMDPTRPALADPRNILGAIERSGATNLFGSPALIARVGRHGALHGARLPSLRRVISAGAPVPAAVIERFATLLAPGAQVFTPYGATEALPVASIGSDEILGETRRLTEAGRGVCVGRRAAPTEVAVIRVSDEPIEEWSDDLKSRPGEVGEIAVRGPVVTREYFGRPEATRLSKIELRDGSGGFWHRMGDLGYLDAKGRLWFCGRKSQRVAAPGGDMHTIPCEAVFNTHPRVFRTALVGVRRWGATEGDAVQPVLVVELEKTRGRNRKGRRDAVRRELLEMAAAHSHTRPIRTVLFHRAFPVDVRHNAKIGREKLAAWAGRRLS